MSAKSELISRLDPEELDLYYQNLKNLINAGASEKAASTKALSYAVKGQFIPEAEATTMANTFSNSAERLREANRARQEAIQLGQRLSGLRGIDFLQKPAVQTALGTGANAVNFVRNNPATAIDLTAAAVGAPLMGYMVGDFTDTDPYADKVSQKDIEAYLANNPKLQDYAENAGSYDSDTDFEQYEPSDGTREYIQAKPKYVYGKHIVDADSMD